MKHPAITLTFLWMLMGCSHFKKTAPPPTSAIKSEGVTYYISVPWGHTNALALSSTRGAGLSNSVLYADLDVFLKFIDSLPAGSTLDHDAGCVVPSRYQFADKGMEVTELKRFCRQRGINVHIYGSW